METVKIYLEYINYLGEITDSTLIAEFKTPGWADIFIKQLKPTNGSRYRINNLSGKGENQYILY